MISSIGWSNCIKGGDVKTITNPTQEIPAVDLIDHLNEWIYRMSGLRAALELELWEKVASGEDTAEKIAAQEGWDLIGSRLILNAMVDLGLLDIQVDHYALVPISKYYLMPGKPTYQGGVLLHEYHWEGDGKLAQAIRSGKRPVQYDATKSDKVDLWKAVYSRSWEYPETLLKSAGELWKSIGIQARDGLRILDIACGPAPRSMALAYKQPGVKLTWLDWQGVLEIAMQVASRLNISDQVSLLPGDLWSTSLENSAYDLGFLGNVTHFFSPQENTRIFSKVFTALVPGGIIVVNSAARRESEGSVWNALWLYGATATGGAYDFNEYKSMLEDADFKDVVDINQGPIMGVKPI
jgi:SAM-dependent methyltransferase